MNILVLVALGVATGFGAEHEWAKFQNTMTQWKYGPCNLVAYKLQNK